MAHNLKKKVLIVFLVMIAHSQKRQIFFKKGFRTGIPFFEFENQIRKAFIAGYKLGQGEEESRNKKTIADLLSQVTELRGIK